MDIEECLLYKKLGKLRQPKYCEDVAAQNDKAKIACT